MARKKPGRAVRKAPPSQVLPAEKIAWLVLLGAIALVSAYIAITSFETVRVPAAVIQSDLVMLTNQERVANSVGVLTESPTLDEAAQAKANDMAAKGYFSHVGPDGTLPWAWFKKFGYEYHFAGENLAVRFSDSKEVVDAWMASPTHRANIVKPQYTQIGIGVANGTYQGEPATFVVQFFGSPQPTYSQPTPAPPAVASAGADTPSPRVSTAAPAVAGAETTVPVETTSQPISTTAHPSFFDQVAGFFAFAWRSLTASTADSGGIIIGDGVSTER